MSIRKLLLFTLLLILGIPCAEAGKVYFDNSSTNWTTPHAYTWKGNTPKNGNWPGTAMTPYQDNIWVIDLSETNIDGLIFNSGSQLDSNNSVMQTSDLVYTENYVYIKGSNQTDSTKGDIEEYLSSGDSSSLKTGYWFEPATASADEELVLHFNRANTSLKDATAIYIWTGVITDASESDSDWKHGMTCKWESLSSETKYKMTQDASNANHFTMTFTPSVRGWYGATQSENINKIAFIIRDADGTKYQDANCYFTLKTTGGNTDPEPDPDPTPDPSNIPDPADLTTGYWFEPDEVYGTDSTTLHFNRKNTSLSSSDDIYIWTGLITDKSTSDSDWKHGMTGKWENIATADAKYKMTRVSQNHYTLSFSPSINEWYGTDAGETAKKIVFIIRNADGNKYQDANCYFTLKTTGGNTDPEPDPDPTPDPSNIPDPADLNTGYWFEPAEVYGTDSTTLHFNRKNTSLSNSDDIYIWTGLITDKSTSDSDWKHGITGKWEDIAKADAKYKMTRVSQNHYTLSFSPSINEWYGTDAGETAKKIVFIIRNAGGTKYQEDNCYFTLKTTGGNTDPTPGPTPDEVLDREWWITPSSPKASDAITIHYNRSKASKDGMKNVSPIYLYTQIQTTETTSWSYGPSWDGTNNDKYKMTVDPNNANHYTLTMSPSVDEWFSVPQGESANKILLIFRNADGGTQTDNIETDITPSVSTVVIPSALGAVTDWSADEHTVTFTCEGGELNVTPYEPEVVKIFTLYTGSLQRAERRSISVCDTPKATFTVSESDANYSVEVADGVTVNVEKSNARVSFIGTDGNLMLEENGGLVNKSRNVKVTFRGMNDGAFYGGGYNGGWTDWNNKTMTMDNAQNWGWNSYSGGSRCINVPFYVSTSGYGVYFDDHYRGATITPSSDGTTYSSGSIDPIAYYFVGGGSMERVMQNYTLLTGRQPLPPVWGLGYITSKYGYKTESEAKQVIKSIKDIGAPIDGIVFDLYWEGLDESGMGNLEWEGCYDSNMGANKFTDGPKMMKDFLDDGVHTVVITEPFFTSNCSNYNTLKTKGYFADDDVSGMEWLKSPKSGLIDASNPEAMSWMADFYEKHTRSGMSGWWLDLGEPERHDAESVHQGGTVSQVHNEFGLLWIEAVYNRLHEKFPEMRHLLMPRAGTSGMQRYATFPWTGDIARSWSGLQAQIPALVNASMSGIGYIGSDTGGFACTEGYDNAPLYLRWIQFAVFSPSMRTHSANVPEPYNSCYSSVKNDVVKFINKRYSYLPYLYTLAYGNATHGTPLARPVNYFDEEPSTLGSVKDEYLWGPDILVAPVITDATQRTVKFPDGRWMDLNNYTDVYSGGTSINYSAPMSVLPHFGRIGSIIPHYAQSTFTNTASIDRSVIMLDVLLDNDIDCFGQLYDDSQTGFDPISKGEYLLSTFTAQHRNGGVDFFITNEGKGYEGMPETRTFIITMHNHGMGDDANVYWGYNHKGVDMPKTIVRRAQTDDDVIDPVTGDNGTLSNEYNSLNELMNADGDGYVRDDNKTHVKLSVPARSNYSLTLGYDNTMTGVESTGFERPLAVSYGAGMITYTVPENFTDASIEVYTTTGVLLSRYDTLETDGLSHQIAADLETGLYICRISAKDKSGIQRKKAVKAAVM